MFDRIHAKSWQFLEGRTDPVFDGSACVSRTSPFSGNHVDILHNQDVIRGVLLIAAGHAEKLGEVSEVSSSIDSIVAKMPLRT